MREVNVSSRYLHAKLSWLVCLYVNRFKVKVGSNRDDDDRRVGLVRQLIGDENLLVRIICI
jgi:hypothetical protein